MSGFLDKLKIKRAPKEKAQKPAASGKASFWARKKKTVEQKNDDPSEVPRKAAKSLSWRKAPKEKDGVPGRGVAGADRHREVRRGPA